MEKRTHHGDASTKAMGGDFMQAMLVAWRTNHREVLPFSGLDPRLNRTVPPQLIIDEVDAALF